MKIGLLNNLYGIYSHGGAETIVKMMVNDYKKSGHDVFLITTKPAGAKADEATIKEIKTYYINSNFYNLGKTSKLYRAFWQLTNLFSFSKYHQIKKILADEKPDLIITHNLMGLGFLAPLAIKKLKINHEHFLHDIQLIHPSGLMIWGKEKKISSLAAKIYQFFTRYFFASVSKVISPSRWLLELHTSRGFFKNADKEIRPFIWKENELKIMPRSDGRKNFIFLGQVEKQKGIFFLIETFKKISDSNINFTIAFRNAAGEIEYAKKLAADDNRIKFLGPLSFEEATEAMRTSDYLVVPSLCYENSPSVIYGAHSLGLKVIASNIGGIPEIMKGGDKLFKPGDSEDLKNKLLA